MLGESYLNYGDYQEAILCYEKAISFVPDFGEAYHGLALCYEKTGKMNLVLYAEAMEDYSSGLTEEAITKLEEVVVENGNNANVYLGLGLACENNGEIVKAISAYEQALLIDPDLWLAKAKVDALKVKG